MLFHLTPELNQKVESVLEHTVQRSEASSVYLSDKGGNIVSQFSRVGALQQEDNISALAAGSFFATQQLARLLGEDGFHCVFHQGDECSIYMQCLASEMVMLVVFGKDSNPGLVRLHASKACASLDAVLAEAEGAAPSPGAIGLQFELNDSARPFSPST